MLDYNYKKALQQLNLTYLQRSNPLSLENLKLNFMTQPRTLN